MRNEINLLTEDGYCSTAELRQIIKKLKYPEDRFHDICFFGSVSIEEAFGFEDEFLNDLSVENICGIITSLTRHYQKKSSEDFRLDIEDRIDYLERYLSENRGTEIENWLKKRERKKTILENGRKNEINRITRLTGSNDLAVYRQRQKPKSFFSFFQGGDVISAKKKNKKRRNSSMIMDFFNGTFRRRKVHPSADFESLKYMHIAHGLGIRKFEKTYILPQKKREKIGNNIRKTSSSPPPLHRNSKISVIDVLYYLNVMEIASERRNSKVMDHLYAKLAENLLNVLKMLSERHL